MTRVPLVSDERADDVTREVFAGFQREGREPISLYRALANAPALLQAYSVLARSLRHDADTDRGLRELVILRTAQLTGSSYAWAHHVPMATAAGISEAQIAALGSFEADALFDETQRAALRAADAVHALAVDDETYDALAGALGARGALEVLMTAAFYASVVRLVQALDLDVE
ncbi:MAG TPA: carboxymuconolactone decarboxylase family protein [Gaiellaceae bacterium]|nr:carboxymuconolactone decarboxylase family protein [Gaiellaceae bacterium]